MRMFQKFRQWACMAILSAGGLSASSVSAEDICQPLVVRPPQRPVMHAGGAPRSVYSGQHDPYGQSILPVHGCTADSGCATGVGCADQLPSCGEACGQDGCGGGSGLNLSLCGPLGDAWDLSDTYFLAMGVEDPSWDFGGNFATGYHTANDGVLNRNPDNIHLHQAYLYIEKTVDGSDGLDLGGRFDILYGTDGYAAQSYGNNRGRWDFQDAFDHGIYAWAIPQLYAQAAWGDWTVKAGHFWTLAGFEVVPAAGRPFYSGAFSWFYSEPFTHTGVQISRALGENFTFHSGTVLGWDSGFDRFEKALAWHGGFTAQLTDSTSLAFMTCIGNNGWIGEGYTQHVVLTQEIGEKLTYVGVSDLVHGNTNPYGDEGSFDTISLYHYLIYQATDRIATQGRAEWLKANGTSYYELTAGLRVNPTANWTLRPEVRYQWSPAAEGSDARNILGIENLGSGAIFGIDSILTF